MRFSFYRFSEDYISELSEQDVFALNRKLNFKTRSYNGIPVLNHYLSTAQACDDSFIQFLLKERKIELDVNTVDENGKSTLVNAYEKKLNNFNLIENLFKRGYVLTESDIEQLKGLFPKSHNSAEIVLIEFYNKVSTEEHIELISNYRKLFYIIESE